MIKQCYTHFFTSSLFPYVDFLIYIYILAHQNWNCTKPNFLHRGLPYLFSNSFNTKLKENRLCPPTIHLITITLLFLNLLILLPFSNLVPNQKCINQTQSSNPRLPCSLFYWCQNWAKAQRSMHHHFTLKKQIRGNFKMVAMRDERRH